MMVTLEQRGQKIMLNLSGEQIEQIAALNGDTRLIINAPPPLDVEISMDAWIA